jgi:hypothetical protein
MQADGDTPPAHARSEQTPARSSERAGSRPAGGWRAVFEVLLLDDAEVLERLARRSPTPGVARRENPEEE